jgi:hypothetical protein
MPRGFLLGVRWHAGICRGPGPSRNRRNHCLVKAEWAAEKAGNIAEKTKNTADDYT